MSNRPHNNPYILNLILAHTLFVVSLFSSPAVWAAAVSNPTPEGMLPHFESWIALLLIFFALGTAWLLNHRSPKIRASGTLLGSIGCFGVVWWFSWVLGSGVIESPKPFQAPMDALKPGILWAQTVIAMLCGIGLIGVANRQRKSGEALALSSLNEPTRYGRTSRVLHWATAILFILMIPMGVFASMIPEHVWYRTEYNMVHKTIGFVILALFVIRLFWNRISKRPELDASLKPIEKKLAHFAHVSLYVLLFTVPLTGYVMTSLHGYPSYIFAIEIQPLLAESKTYIYWGLFHKYVLQYIIYLMLGAHVIGALKHHYIDQHKAAFKRMVS